MEFGGMPPNYKYVQSSGNCNRNRIADRIGGKQDKQKRSFTIYWYKNRNSSNFKNTIRIESIDKQENKKREL